MSAPALLRELVAFARHRQWYFGKVPLLLGLLLVIHVQAGTRPTVAALLGWTGLFCGFLAASYMLNNVSDAEVDARAGKAYALALSNRGRAALALGVAFATTAGAVFALSWPALAVLAATWLLSAAYSFPPRLKEHVWLGPVVAATAQLTAPAGVLVTEHGAWTPASAACMLAMSLYGLRMILVHQLLDEPNDRATGVQTTVTRLGARLVRRILAVGFVLEAAATLLLLGLLVRAGMPPWLLGALAIPAVGLAVYLAGGGRVRLDRYDWIPLAALHESLLPLLAATSLALAAPAHAWWISAVIVALFLPRHVERLMPRWYMIAGPRHETEL